jgi:hypothetical protein
MASAFGRRPFCCTFLLMAIRGGGRWSLAKSKRHPAKSSRLIAEVQKGNVVVSLPGGGFTAVYYRTARRPHLTLRERTKTDDQELLAEALQAKVAKARELGWIV